MYFVCAQPLPLFQMKEHDQTGICGCLVDRIMINIYAGICFCSLSQKFNYVSFKLGAFYLQKKSSCCSLLLKFHLKSSNRTLKAISMCFINSKKKTHTEPNSTYEKIKSRSLNGKKMTA